MRRVFAMLMLVAIERFRDLFVQHQRAPRLIAPAARSVETRHPPVAPLIVEIPTGTRYQLLRALRAMAKGEYMVVEHRIPKLSKEYLEDDDKRAEWFRSLRGVDGWCNASEIDPLLVPGTAYPAVIGRILIRAGWCTPVKQPHWVPNLRFFILTEKGYETLKRAQAWWRQLPPLERLRLMLCE
jgi:hypothetical protein